MLSDGESRSKTFSPSLENLGQGNPSFPANSHQNFVWLCAPLIDLPEHRP